MPHILHFVCTYTSVQVLRWSKNKGRFRQKTPIIKTRSCEYQGNEYVVVLHSHLSVHIPQSITEIFIIEATRWVSNVFWHPDICAFHVSNQLFDSQNVSTFYQKIYFIQGDSFIEFWICITSESISSGSQILESNLGILRLFKIQY